MQIKAMKLLFAYGFSTLLLCSCTSSQKVMTICDMAENANDLNQATVRIRATYLPDRMHGSVLVDKNCPDVALNPMPLMSAKTEAFRRAVFGDIYHPATPFKIDFSGKFTAEKDGKLIGNVEILEVHSYEKQK
ncbi:MAG: hypothetical protein ACREPB_07765 [Arenimonas sp.]